jgi:predicted GIY-YIG superfamily endonuclease
MGGGWGESKVKKGGILDNKSYIGSTNDLYKRLSNHKRQAVSARNRNRHPKFYNYVNKHG